MTATRRRVRRYRWRARAWLALGVLVGIACVLLPRHAALILLTTTTVCSFYANYAGDNSAAEAADDRLVISEVRSLRVDMADLQRELRALRNERAGGAGGRR